MQEAKCSLLRKIYQKNTETQTMPVTYEELLYDKGGILSQYKVKDRSDKNLWKC